jgi:hypothetical protein
MPERSRSWAVLSARLAMHGALHPRAATALVTVAWRFRRRGWYRRFPFLPLPDADYVKWRMHTAYGDHGIVPSAEDVIRYALWAARD